MNLTKSKLFLICCLVFMVGIMLASFLPADLLNYKIIYFSLIITALILLVLFWQSIKLRLVSLIIIFLFFGLWRYSVSLPPDTPDKIWHYNGQQISFSGIITKEPDIRQDKQKLEITASFSSTLKNNISGRILITTNLYPAFKYGDELAITCELQAPEKFNDFAYDRYLARYDIYSVCYYPKIEKLAAGKGNWLYSKIFTLKDKLINIIDFGLGEPAVSLARPIVFGGQRGLADNIRQQFSQTGLTHIMAVSGFNTTILSAIVLGFLLAVGLDRRRAFYLSIIFLLIYIILVGAPASAMRAGIMSFLVLWALHLGRLNKITNAIVLAGAILLLFNPKILRDDIGFQLSFLAVLGLIYCYPLIDKFLEKIKIPRLYGLRDILSLTLGAQIFTWPIMAYNFSQISLIAPLANVLVIWLIPFLTVAIIVALPLSFLLPGLASLFFLPSLISANYIFGVVKILSRVPYAYWEIGYWPWGVLAVYYLGVIFIIIKLQRSKLLDNRMGDKI